MKARADAGHGSTRKSLLRRRREKGHRRRNAAPALNPEQEALVEEHHELVRKLARKIVSKRAMPIEPDEAISCALVGLVDAASRYDEDRVNDGAFMSFAYPRIQGEIIDHVRRNGIVPRAEFAQGERAQMVSIDTVGVPTDRESATTAVAPVELSAQDDDPDLYIDLRSALSGLNERERYVVTAFATGATGTEIAQELGISETRFWSILAVARAKLERDLAA